MTFSSLTLRMLVVSTLVMGVAGCGDDAVSSKQAPAVESSPPTAIATPDGREFKLDFKDFPAQLTAGEQAVVSWTVTTPSADTSKKKIDFAGLFYGSESVPTPTSPHQYPVAGPNVCQGVECGIPGDFQSGLDVTAPGTYHARALVVVDGKQVWSPETTFVVSEAAAADKKAHEAKKDKEAVAPTPAGSLREFSVSVVGGAFSPASLQARVGDHVRLVFSDPAGSGSLNIPAFGIDVTVPSSVNTATAEFVVDRPGTFPITCGTSAACAAKPMTGELVVK